MAVKIEAAVDSRCELIPRLYPPILGKFFREPFDRERWYRFSVFVESLGEAPQYGDLSYNTIVAQWHSSPDPFLRKESGRGPPLALRIYNGTWGFTYGSDANFRSVPDKSRASNWHWVGEVQRGRWTDWTIRVIWSYENSGLTEIWKDAQLVMRRSGPNAFNDLRGVYLKLGLYHPTADQTIYLDNISIQNSRE